MMSALGGVPDDFDYEFNPVRRPPATEMADLASKNTDSVTKAFQAGLISQRVALKELRQQSEQTGMWTNITDEDGACRAFPILLNARSIALPADSPWKR